MTDELKIVNFKKDQLLTLNHKYIVRVTEIIPYNDDFIIKGIFCTVPIATANDKYQVTQAQGGTVIFRLFNYYVYIWDMDIVEYMDIISVDDLKEVTK